MDRNDKFKKNIYMDITILEATIPPATRSEFSDIVTIPTTITVHLGSPDEPAENVTIPFIDYVQNVASSELYPTWPENALIANILAISTFAINRVYTEWYRSRGYNFDITNSTQYDQAFVYNRGIYDTISNISDEIFNQYIIKEGNINPIFTRFCDGRISQCDGLLQWGTVELANRGYTPYEILQYYYGDDIQIVMDAPIGEITESYPGEPLKLGDSGMDVLRMQLELDRITENYPAIPKINNKDGYFSAETERAVREFQKVFNLPVTGTIDKGTWYRIVYIYTAVTKLAEVTAEDVSLNYLLENASQVLLEGSNRPGVEFLQYFLTLLSLYYDDIPNVPITGIFDTQTRNGVVAFQQTVGLPVTGIVTQETWDAIYDNVLAIFSTLPPNLIYIPYARWNNITYDIGHESPVVYIIQQMLSYISIIIPYITSVTPTGIYNEETKNAVLQFQEVSGLEQTGTVNEETWYALVDIYQQQRFGGASPWNFAF